MDQKDQREQREQRDQAESLRQWVGRRGGLRVIAVASGKGGVGKSNLTANLAVYAARGGARVLVVDADLGLANVEILFGLKPKHHLGHVLEGVASLREVLARGPHGIDVLPAGSGVQWLTRLNEAQKVLLTAELDSLEDSYDLVLIDTGAGIGDNVIFFASAAQQVLLVVSPEPTSLTDAYAAVKVLSHSAGVSQFDVVVNSVATPAYAKEVFRRLTGVTGRFLTAQLRYAGYIPQDEHVPRAVMAQRPLYDLFPRSPAARAFESVGRALFDSAPPAQLGGLKFLWQRLMREATA